MTHVVHLTSVHPPFDVRIFHKECRSLAEAGYQVTLIAPHAGDEHIDGVRIVAVPPSRNRLARMLRTGWQVYRAALRAGGDLYHIHDPELLPYALLLRKLHRAPVIYDVHEDYVTDILQKRYLPHGLRWVLARLVGWLERFAQRHLAVVIAEKYYARRFPQATAVLNYPRLEPFPDSGEQDFAVAPRRLLYTGTIALDRGALIHASLVRIVPDVEVHMVGKCAPALAERMFSAAGDGAPRLHIEGIGTFVPHEVIAEYYRRGPWLAGLALFPSTPHYVEKELTKFFEYMWAGIPILCSDFPVWRALVEETGAGLTVDPDDPQAIAQAIQWLLDHSQEAREMGQRGQAAVQTKYNWSVESRKLIELYQQELAKAQTQPVARRRKL